MSGPVPDAGPTLLADPAALEVATHRVAAEVSQDHPDGVTLVGVLKGSIIFLADLARALTVPARIEMVAVSPFDGAATRTRVVKDVDHAVTGASVVLVTALVDTGFTADFLIRHLQMAEPASIRVATLADKPAHRILPITPDYAAIEVPDRFIVGWGLDHRGRYRNARGLWAVDGDALAEDPDRYVSALHHPGHTVAPPR